MDRRHRRRRVRPLLVQSRLQVRPRVLRPHRVAWALAEGQSIDLPPVVEHVVCDNPVCVRADGTLLDHLEALPKPRTCRGSLSMGAAAPAATGAGCSAERRCIGGRWHCVPLSRTAGTTNESRVPSPRSTKHRWLCSDLDLPVDRRGRRGSAPSSFNVALLLLRRGGAVAGQGSSTARTAAEADLRLCSAMAGCVPKRLGQP